MIARLPAPTHDPRALPVTVTHTPATLLPARYPRSTRYLPLRQLRNLVNGMAYADFIGTPMALHVTLAWRYSAGFDPDPRAWMAHQGRVFDSLGKWLPRQGLPVAFLWVREWGPNYGEHTHLVLHLVPELREDLHRHLEQAGSFQAVPGDRNQPIRITPNPDVRACMDSDNQRAGLMRYLLKHASPLCRLDGECVMPALGIDDRDRKPCTIAGKRSGVSHSIGRKARAAAGWRELVTIPELRAALPTDKRRRRRSDGGLSPA